MFYKDVQSKSAGVFKRLTGVKRSTFEKMVSVVKEHLWRKRKHPSRGAPPKAAVEDQVLMMLMYYREYRTFLHTATSYGYSESQGWRIVRRMEDILIKSGVFRLPGKKVLLKMESGLLGKLLVVDVGESPVERPKKKQRRYYSGKKKRHTQKIQLIVTLTGKIICVAIGKGRMHDFRLYRESKTHLHSDLTLKADSGYQGVKKLHGNSEVPHKRSKKKPLTLEQKAYNRSVSSERVVVEHVLRKLKVFRILSERYRNRRKRFGLRVNLIAAILNYELEN
ncbi:MAG: IS5 family transposase [Flavisolibacter sp.]|nr:IS5 family transposase [Flavisolibacter sp.]